MDNSTLEIRSEQWRSIVQNCLASGISKKTWCKENGISEKAFYYWQRKFRQEVYDQSKSELPVVQTTFAEVPMVIQSEPETDHLPPISRVTAPDIVIRTATITIEISGNASPAALALVKQVMKHAT